MDFKVLLLGVLITAIAYLAFPIICLLVNKGRFSPKGAHRIALWNSIVLGIVFCFLTNVLSEGITTWNAAPAFLYYMINRAILADNNITESHKNNDKRKN